ncbi:MAG: hypothetical protein KJ749_13040, partial [Planctomycetes bacterium]|nr:hypothetical protein [Planctomycetota bacterium]
EDELVGRCLAALPDQPIDPALAMAICMRAYSPKGIAEVSRALRLSNRLLSAVVWLVGSLPAARAASSLELADLKTLMAHAECNSLLELLRADSIATGSGINRYDCLVKRAAGVANADITPPPFITGADLADCGIPPGPRVGRLLGAAYRAQLNERITSREQALEYVRDLITSGTG